MCYRCYGHVWGSLAAHYSFDEGSPVVVASDSSVYGRHALFAPSMDGSVSRASSVAGGTGALLFNTPSSSVRVSAQGLPSQQASRSMFAWVKVRNSEGGGSWWW